MHVHCREPPVLDGRVEGIAGVATTVSHALASGNATLTGGLFAEVLAALSDVLRSHLRQPAVPPRDARLLAGVGRSSKAAIGVGRQAMWGLARTTGVPARQGARVERPS
jgi:hypothetical protein